MSTKIIKKPFSRNHEFSKVSKIAQTNEVAKFIDIPQNQEALVLTENIPHEVQTSSAVNPNVRDITVSGENGVQNFTMLYQDIFRKSSQSIRKLQYLSHSKTL